ncbi:hypothetical protein RIF29_00397 [Crotalaria pallida]|uniref:Uncharacterized protein n=1 Tax=Crotalaria pallida TaxID=3830 RepID=A0AAN9P6K4_CROPI
MVTIVAVIQVIQYAIFHKSGKATETELQEVVVDYIRCKLMLGLFSPLHHHDVATFILGSIITAPTLLSYRCRDCYNK